MIVLPSLADPEDQQVFIIGIHFYFNTFPIRGVFESIGYQIDNNGIQKPLSEFQENLLRYLTQEGDISGFSHINKDLCRIFH